MYSTRFFNLIMCKYVFDIKVRFQGQFILVAKLKALFKVNQSFDCPGFEGLYNFCQLAVGGSIDAADMITTGLSDIVINWSGGYHHAKKT